MVSRLLTVVPMQYLKPFGDSSLTTVKIITDSTCDLPPAIRKQYNIGTIPVNVILDDNLYSQYDITNDDFYSRMAAGELASTGVPSPNVFKIAFDDALEEFDDVIVFTLSSKLSGVFQTATMVAKQFFDDRIIIIDSAALTLQLGLAVYEAAKFAREGKTREEIITLANNVLIPKNNILGVIATLKNLKRSGRIGAISWLLGSLLSVKPLLQLEDGLIVSPGKVRNLDHGMTLLKKTGRFASEHREVDTIFCAHARNPERGKELVDFFKDLPNPASEIFCGEIGPSMGTHIGPGAFGFAWLGRFEKEWL